MQEKISSSELKVAFGYASIFAFRMLGLFMIFPVFSLFATKQYPDATPSLIGLAVGIYGISQACLQIPFGIISDKIGRKKVIFAGLLVFAIGSLVAAKANSIYAIIAGRMLQGMGAIGSTIIASISDSTKKSVQNKIMGVVGATIGMSFILSFVFGPIITESFGLSGIFYLNFICALIGMITLFLLPKIHKPKSENLESHKNKPSNNIFNQITISLFNKKLFSYYLGIFVLHATLTSLFLTIPKILSQYDLVNKYLTSFYLLVFILSAIVSFGLLYKADKNKNANSLQLMSFFGLIISEIILFLFKSKLLLLIIALTLFFVCFNFLESSFPASTSKESEQKLKGTSLGIFSTFQFLGIFFGGFAGGIISEKYGDTAIILFAITMAITWVVAKSLLGFNVTEKQQQPV